MKRVIAISGGAGGIGRTLATTLTDDGCELMLFDRPGSGVGEVAERLGAVGVEGTFTDANACRMALGAVRGSVHGFVHLAGLFEPDPDLGDDADVWRRVMQNNLDNGYAFATAMAERFTPDRMGRMVFTSSLAYRRGAFDYVAYSAAKGGLVGLTRALARRFRKVATVNAVAPGIIQTRMTERLIETARDKLLAEIPLGRFGEPGEIARVIRFLLSDDASFITGQTINVDGGQVMT